ncbi:MAG: RDD family protein, partial [Bdellovibrionales bacterium]|nr:RDD family protein [Bdellovibrionales bacterium]
WRARTWNCEEKMRFAGFWIRFLAHLVDFLIWNAVEFALEWGITKMLGLSATAEQIVGVILSLLIACIYYVEIPLNYGTTPGKKIFGIYVVRLASGETPTRKTLVLRLVGYVFSYLVLGCGFLMVLFHPKKLGLHDIFSGTACVRMRRVPKTGAPVSVS